jgi:hypothetical protein
VQSKETCDDHDNADDVENVHGWTPVEARGFNTNSPCSCNQRLDVNAGSAVRRIHPTIERVVVFRNESGSARSGLFYTDLLSVNKRNENRSADRVPAHPIFQPSAFAAVYSRVSVK